MHKLTGVFFLKKQCVCIHIGMIVKPSVAISLITDCKRLTGTRQTDSFGKSQSYRTDIRIPGPFPGPHSSYLKVLYTGHKRLPEKTRRL